MKAASLVRAGLVLALAAGLFLAAANRDLLDGELLRQRLADAGAWAPVAFVALYGLATVLFLPGSVLTLAAGALFGPLLGALYSLAGATLGAALAFAIARHLAGEWVSRRAGGRLRRLMDGVEAEGWRFVAFVRLVPLFPFNLVNYAFGLTRVGLVPYVLTSLVAMAPGALAYAWLGHAGHEALVGSESAIRSGLLALGLLAAVAFLPRLLRRFKAAAMITPQALKALQAEGGILLLDVREAADFEGELGHVPFARNIPLPQLESHLRELEPWRDGGLVLICRSQVRSAQAARCLAGHGFRDLRVVRGGTLAWQQLGFATSSAARNGRSGSLQGA